MDSSEITLYPYQRAWLEDPARFAVGMFARQTGKTFTTTLAVVLDTVRAELDGKRTRWIILSRGERQAREAMEAGVKLHLAAIGTVFQAHEYEWEPGINALEVTLPGGSRITALPANPDTARGFSANVMLDEFAFHADSRKIWTALFPVISAGWKLRVVSTPNGKGNKFYELMTDKALDGIWSRHTVDIYQAVADGLPRDIEALRLGINDPDAWAQEYELKWLDEASAWLPYELIDGCEHAGAGLPDHYSGGPCFIGIDIAARNDLFVIAVLEAVGDVLWCREMIVRRRIKFAEQDVLLDEVMRRYRVVRVAMDQTGMGEKPVEDAQRRHGQLRVEGVLFSAARKLDMATALKERMEDHTLRLPMGDALLRADLHAIKKQVGVTGIPRLLADGDTDGHADRFWALALACAAGSGPVVQIDFQSAGSRAGNILGDAGLGGFSQADITRTGWGTVSGNHDFTGF
ncbi:phage terminase, large subunit [Sulfuriferula multivorans]|uniref:Phage terminase, large subunit n=1 Tax=Sulfuriferula multivorans TaxID=1559896 RepID=A0A401JF79_9PROT|nr:terminase family protein [Sulfuriferula multivorans]GBL46266.1 phage terminase, large subunit [Sulfuriferula multivorans]